MSNIDLTKSMKLVWKKPVLKDGIHSMSDSTGNFHIHKSIPFGYTVYKRAKLIKLANAETAQEARELCEKENERQ